MVRSCLWLLPATLAFLPTIAPFSIQKVKTRIRQTHGKIKRVRTVTSISTLLLGEIRVRDWEEGDEKYIYEIISSAFIEFDPEGPFEEDCGSIDAIKKYYPNDNQDRGCLLVATDMTTTSKIIGIAALVVGSSITSFSSGSLTLSNPEQIKSAARRIYTINCKPSTQQSIISSLLNAIEIRARLSGANEIIALAYQCSCRPKQIDLESFDYHQLPPTRQAGVDVIQYRKFLEPFRESSTELNVDTTHSNTESNTSSTDIGILALLVTSLLAILFGVANFLGLEIFPANDNNRGIGTPLSIQELRVLKQDEQLKRTDLDREGVSSGERQWKDLDSEELREETALMKIIQGQDSRLR